MRPVKFSGGIFINKFAQVILKTANSEIDRIFDYEIPFEFLDSILPGMRVIVPFGAKNSYTEGYVISLSEKTDVPKEKLKLIASVPDKYAIFSKEMIELSMWMKEKYYTTLTQCLQTMIPAGIDQKSETKVIKLNISGDRLEAEKEKLRSSKNKAAQLLVVDFIEKFGPSEAYEIRKYLKISSSPIKTLLKNGVLKEETKQKRRSLFESEISEHSERVDLTSEQKSALNMAVSKSKTPLLIHGVTGSGKTEIYMRAIENFVSKGYEAIVLVPEISLTPQLSKRFFQRFGNAVAMTHSRMSDGERLDVWQRAKNKEISVMIGPRSAVFAPFENIGLIIIDEEHETSYKSETTPKYDAREIAEFRCKNRGKVIYGTATPSIETYTRAVNGEIDLAKLVQRPLNRMMPKVEIADMRYELASGNTSIFSRALYNGIKMNIEKKLQTVLFINRRGFSTFISCRKCGYVMTCGSCSVSYTYHINENILKCHYCGKTENPPNICPQCGSKYIKYFGTGTQKVEEEIKKFFPSARVLRMDTDTTKKKNSHKAILESFGCGNADILVGTQMIAKGHDFPNVTLVGIVAADTSLNNGDFRSGETTFQLITQVSGRAGRGDIPGNVIIQTYNPNNYVIQLAAKGDYENFYKKEAIIRKSMNYPPFFNIFAVLAFGKNEEDVIREINALFYIMKQNDLENKFMLFNPAPAFVSKIKDEFRWRLLIKGKCENELKEFVLRAIDEHKKKCSRKVIINIFLNPQSIV